MIGLAQIVGCASMPTPARPISGPLPIRVRADWNDLEAAVRRAGIATETAMVRRDISGDGAAGSTARFELISISEQQLWITFRALEPWTPDSGPVPIEINAGTEPLPHEEPSRQLIAEVAKHLKALAGRDWAP